MDHENQESEPRRSGSSVRLSCASPSRSSLSQVDDDVDKIVAEAGDIGDRALKSYRWSSSGRSHNDTESGRIVVPVEGETAFVESEDKKNEYEKEMSSVMLDYVTHLLSLAVFGILGVLARYWLEKFFGPEGLGATSDQNYMYLDFPSNMAGSFLMGWVVVFRGDIMKVSDHLAMGLSTGLLGSLTTFSGWNQKMLELSVNGQWAFTVLGIIIGFFTVAFSIILGIESAKGFKSFIRQSNIRNPFSCISNKSKCISIFMVMLLLILGLLWGLFGSLERKEFKTGSREAQLFFACIVGPFGVWIRWFLARFNGRGLGKNGKLKWLPFGTLAANVLAACLMAALATLKKEINTKMFDTVASGTQFGLLGCLSTVSTFIAEVHSMRENMDPGRAYAYATLNFTISFVLGTLIYSVPVWARGY